MAMVTILHIIGNSSYLVLHIQIDWFSKLYIKELKMKSEKILNE